MERTRTVRADAGRHQRVVASNLAFLQLRSGYEWKVISERSGVSASMLRKIRQGDNVSVDILGNLAAVFGLEPGDLLSPDLESYIDQRSAYARLRATYGSTSTLGREAIDQAVSIAEKLVGYRV